MSYFKDADHLYQVIGTTLTTALEEEPAMKTKMARSGMIFRFSYHEPEAVITVDCTGGRAEVLPGEAGQALKPDFELFLSGDAAHLFWSGRLNLAAAIARREMVARGSVAKAMKLLPALRPALRHYPEVLRRLGFESMIVAGPSGAGRLARSPLFDRVRRLRSRLVRDVPTLAEVDLSPYRMDIPGPGGPAAPPGGRSSEVVPPGEELELRLEMLRRMLLIRAFEEAVARDFADNRLPTMAVHLSTGQEAVAVGACFAMGEADLMTTTHRGHGHMIARGADVKAMMAELYGRTTGLCRGRGGSLHVTEAAIGAVGANGIVGASTLLGAGTALAQSFMKTGGATVVFMGDGATNQGMFHEGVNLASVWDLPAVFVVENNLYGEFTSVEQHCSARRIVDRAAGYGLEGIRVDGNDVLAVHGAVAGALAGARTDGKPVLIECLTYRWRGHMEGDAQTYRSRDEEAEWRARCPVESFRAVLAEEGTLDDESFETMRREAEAAVDEAVEFARSSPDPDVDAVGESLFSPEPAEVLEGVAAVAAAGEPEEMTCSQAINLALAEEMRLDSGVYLLGEDVSLGGYMGVTVDLVDEFGPDRIRDTPISEYAIVGSSVGAAMMGMRPVAEILFSDFLTCCLDPIVNQAAKLRYMSGGQYSIPLVIRTPGGAGFGMAAQHSQSLEAMLMGVPGLIVAVPSCAADARGLLKTAIRSNNPVLFFEHKLLYTDIGPVPAGEHLVPFGQCDVKRPGRDVTVVALGYMVNVALDAAEELSADGIEVEVVDPRTLAPLDTEGILRSVFRTGRLLTMEEGHLDGGMGAEVLARVAETAPRALKSPPARIASMRTPHPYNMKLEYHMTPKKEWIVEKVRRMFGE